MGMSKAEIRHLRLKNGLWQNGLIFLMYILGVLSLVPVEGSIFIGVYCFASLIVLAIGLLTLFKRKRLLHFLPSLQKLHHFHIRLLGARWNHWLMVEGLLLSIIGISALLYYSRPFLINDFQLTKGYVFSFPFFLIIFAVLSNVSLFLETTFINHHRGHGSKTKPLLFALFVPVFVVAIYLICYTAILTIADYIV